MSIPIWDSRMHEIPMPIHSEMVSSDTSISQISGLSMSYSLTVLQSYSLTCSLIGTKAYGHGMSSNLELDFFQNPSECATLGIYLRIFQHLQAGEISDSKSFSQFSNKTPSFNTFNTYFQHIHIIPYPI